MIKLTPKQIEEFDRIHFEQIAARNSLRVAIQFHSNQVEQIEKERDVWWKEMASIHGLDLAEERYEVDRIDGIVTIVPKD